MNGWNAESDAATLLTNVGIPVESHYKIMKDLINDMALSIKDSNAKINYTQLPIIEGSELEIKNRPNFEIRFSFRNLF